MTYYKKRNKYIQKPLNWIPIVSTARHRQTLDPNQNTPNNDQLVLLSTDSDTYWNKMIKNKKLPFQTKIEIQNQWEKEKQTGTSVSSKFMLQGFDVIIVNKNKGLLVMFSLSNFIYA